MVTRAPESSPRTWVTRHGGWSALVPIFWRLLRRRFRGRRAVGVVAVLLFTVTAGQALVGATQIGISNDEPIHQQRMDQWLDTGWYLPPEFFGDDGSIRPDVEAGRLHAYGAAFSAFGHVVAATAGVEQWGDTDHSASAYTARGISVAVLGIAAALAVGYTLRVVTGRWLVGAWAAAATFAMPLWTGYSMFAVKDVPAAAGWTFVTAGLVVALYRPVSGGPAPAETGSPRFGSRPVAVGLLCFAGVWFSFGTRTALWIPLAGTVFIFAVLVACSPGRIRTAVNVKAAAAGLLAGVVAVTALHYRNAAHPVEWLFASVRTSGDFDWTGSTLTAGRLVSEKPPWWYLPAWTASSVPLLLGLLAAIGTVVTIARVTRRRTSGRPSLLRERLGRPGTGMVLWVVQALALPIMATAMSTTMYAGLRQHLYILPAAAALAALGAHVLMQRYHDGWQRSAVLVLLVAAIAVPALEQTRLFPYNFVYKNPLAGPVDGRWEADMHWVSGREALARVPAGQSAWCYTEATVDISGDLVEPTVEHCAGNPKVDVFLPEQGTAVTTEQPPDDGPGIHDTTPDGSGVVEADTPRDVWVIARKYRGSPPAGGCMEHDNVTRPLRGEDVVISYVLRCDASVFNR
ncbi:hypothetical protein [Phytoactinopolyspora halotolerans]|uniref:Glycosyltransferase RgtA/B/C/D-like domain-containing protein n=1 Tax=Phytoactinopolyspora halotolerans TaxID=1981512 RepID=A0A6L9S6Y3_9ACTN|nr:hypothetical protein [Phytoactinopolyspora halotolerans]NEE01225.1 hypothetical protein [Phytoactinopolyspora halotolerans]